MKKFILKILVVIMVFTTGISTITSVPSNVTFSKRNLNGVTIYQGTNSYYKTAKSGNATMIAYCLNMQLATPLEGASLAFKEIITDKGINYIFNNGHGGTWNTALLGSGFTNDQQYYVTQLALWIYQGKLDASKLPQTDKNIVAAQKLANAARTGTVVTPSISLSTGNTQITLDGNFYKSSLMTVTGSGYVNYAVTLMNVPASAQIVTEAGQILTSATMLSAGTKFYVRVPASAATATLAPIVKVSAVAKELKVYRYSTNNATYQDLGVIMANSKDLSAQTTLSVRMEQKAKLIVYKVDSSANKGLAGATLQLKDANGRIIETWTSTTSAKTFDNLEAGRYTITELSAPTGYDYNKEPMNFVLTAGETRTITVYNAPKTPDTYRIQILKIDSATGQPLAGATLQLRDANGRVIETWTSTTSAKSISGLNPGVYSIVETAAPAGYILNSTPVNFTITTNHNNSRVIQIGNTRETKTFTISKQDVATGKELPGAHLTLKDANGKVIESWVSTNTPKVISGLTPGKYTLIETKSPAGYGLSDEVIEFTIGADGMPDRTVIMYNSEIPKTSDINLMTLVAGFVGTIILGGYGMLKLSKQQ